MTARSLLPVLMLLAFAAAPARGAPPGDSPAEKEPVPPAKAEHAEIEQGYRKARSEYYRQRREHAENEQAENPAPKPTPPEPEWIAKHMAAAQRYAGTEDAVPFLLSAVSIGARPLPSVAQKALKTLASDHVASPRLTDLTFSLIYHGRELEGRSAEDALDRIYDGTPHADVKAAMLYAGVAIEKRHAPQPSEARTADMVATLEKAIAHAPESRWAGLAKGDIYELQHLQIGMTAPDIVGEDLDGVPFQLSDYRGKVVVLDFWGDW